jgi:BlaI family penicillinase repressor
MMMTERQTLSSEEHRVMRILWDRGGASASELAQALSADKLIDHAEALKILRSLDTKGAVERHQNGRNVVYKPRLNRETARSHALGRLLEALPTGADNGLGVVVLRECDFEPQDWADLEAERAEKAALRSGRR